jgi:hypothetical protein
LVTWHAGELEEPYASLEELNIAVKAPGVAIYESTLDAEVIERLQTHPTLCRRLAVTSIEDLPSNHARIITHAKDLTLKGAAYWEREVIRTRQPLAACFCVQITQTLADELVTNRIHLLQLTCIFVVLRCLAHAERALGAPTNGTA